MPEAPAERPLDARLEESLGELAAHAREHLVPEQRARLMNNGGDLCYEAGQYERALLYFDAAIDLYIAAAKFAAAAAICEKLLRLNPRIIRAHCTLAWLAIARGLDDDAARRVEEYGEAALRLERPAIAQRQLRAMKRLTVRAFSKRSPMHYSNSETRYRQTESSVSRWQPTHGSRASTRARTNGAGPL
jgi:tetratricopeptide (TPR) repeat protein